MAAGGTIVLGIVGVVSLTNRPPKPMQPSQSSGLTIPWLPDTVKRWEDEIVAAAERYNLDPNLLAIIITVESGGYSKAKSEAGAQGLMQVTPPTGKDIAAKHLRVPTENYDLNDPRTNIEFGAAYVAFLRDEFGEDNQGPSWNTTAELIAAGYNGGPGAAGRLYRGEGLTGVETVSYSRDVYNMWRERNTKESPTFNRWLERGGFRLIDKAKAEQ